MSTITSKDGAEIYYKDWGTGPVVTFSHGWPLNADAWAGQVHVRPKRRSRGWRRPWRPIPNKPANQQRKCGRGEAKGERAVGFEAMVRLLRYEKRRNDKFACSN